MVRAILRGDPYLVFTDGLPSRPVSSRWENPFLVGAASILRVELFDAPGGD